VLESLSWLLGELFALSIEPVAFADTWHEDAYCYRLLDAAGNVRSYYYLDLYARAGKRGGAWMDDLQGRRLCSDGSIQLPIALINCNFTPPSGKGPALLTHDEVETLFHEFGHALQHMLTTVNYPQVAGISGIPWDAVEFPSQFFEHWAWEPAVLTRMTEHVKTGEPISDELQEKMRQARHFQAAMRMLRQVEFSLFDMRLHSEYTGTEVGQVARILKEVRDQVTVSPVVEPNRFQNGFSHIFDGGYAAGYYSYKWAEVMAVDAFLLFKDKGLFDQEIAKKFLNCVLEPGGSEDPAILFQRLAGRDPDPQALLRHDQILIGE
jgi:oligopeptidase A